MKKLDTTHIWKEFSNELKYFIMKNISIKDDADDILQEVFIKIHNKIDTLQDPDKLKPWIYQIVRNVILDYYKSKKTKIEIDESNFTEEYLEKNEVHSKIADGLGNYIRNLPQKYYDALCLVECAGLSQEEMAKELNLSLPGAKSRVQRAKRMIKDDLMKCCHFEFDKYGTIIEYHPVTCCCCDHSKEK